MCFTVLSVSTKSADKLFCTVCQHNLSLAVDLIYFSCDLFSYTKPEMVYL